MKVNERLWLNAEKSKLLPEGHPEAAMLYAAPGDEIPEESAQRFGLVDGGLPVKQAGKGGNKQGAEGEDKQGAKGGNKRGAKGGNKRGGLTINKRKKEA